MKLSLAWIFDHIEHRRAEVDVDDLMGRVRRTTAEVDAFYKIHAAPYNFDVVVANHIDGDGCLVRNSVSQAEHKLPARAAARVGQSFVVVCEHAGDMRWATLKDVGGYRDALIPAVDGSCTTSSVAHSMGVDIDDYIIEVDNKSLTHRPDLWCHRGFAREIAAILGVHLKPLENFLSASSVKNITASTVKASESGSFSLTLHDSKICQRYAGLLVTGIGPAPCSLAMLTRLARVDCRPIDLVVDGTNYVMLDVGSPLHAFDADKIPTKTIAVRFACPGEKLVLLDGQTVTLSSDDCVITDGTSPLALAGIMGGSGTAVDEQTRAVFVEAACFDAYTIRKTAAHLHVRTESSARFEKTLDPNAPPLALARLVRVWRDAGLTMDVEHPIVCVGEHARENTIIVEHDFLERRLGVVLEHDFVSNALTRLAFSVAKETGSRGVTYAVTVPTFRAGKDITIKEDIVEEVGRCLGYDTIKPILPRRDMAAFSTHAMLGLRALKDIMVNALAMREVYNYALCDEAFLRSIDWEPTETIDIANPLSENARRMVTTLIPGLLNNVIVNGPGRDILRFFEFARTWQPSRQPCEQRVLAGVFFERARPLDFYEIKDLFATFFDAITLNVVWRRMDAPRYPWLAPCHSADLIHEGTVIGYAGQCGPSWSERILGGYAYVFELDGDFLLSYSAPRARFVPSSRYPGVERDVSILVPTDLTVDAVAAGIQASHPSITSVVLVDFFTKDEWHDKRSLTFRCTIHNRTATLTSSDVDTVWSRVVRKLEDMGARVR